MSANLLLPADAAAAPDVHVPESPTYHKDDDVDVAPDKAFSSTPPPVPDATPAPKKPPTRPATAQKQPKSAAAPDAEKQKPPAAKKTKSTVVVAASVASAEKVATKKKKNGASFAERIVSGDVDRAAAKKLEKPAAAAKTKKAAEAGKSKPKKKTTTQISFTPNSRQNGKRAIIERMEEEARQAYDQSDDEEEDEDFVGDEDEEEDDDATVAMEGGAVGIDEDEEEAAVEEESDDDDDDDNATVAITQQQQNEADAKLMSSIRPKPRGGLEQAALRRTKSIEFDEESDAEPAPEAKRKRGGPRKADGESVATVEKNATNSKRRAVEKAGAPAAAMEDEDDAYDMDLVLQKNAKRFKLVPRIAGEPLTTVSVRKIVTKKTRDGVSTSTTYKLLQLESTRRCAYSKAELMRPNKEDIYRVDMGNFLHFAVVEKGEYKMENVLSFFVERDGTMCACQRRFLLQLFFLDYRLDYNQFSGFYNELAEYKAANARDGIPPVPPSLYTTKEITKGKPSCPDESKLVLLTAKLVGGGAAAKAAAAAADDDDGRSVVPATEYGGDADDIRSVAPSVRPRAAAAAPNRLSRVASAPLTAAAAATNYGVHTNVDMDAPIFRDMDLVSRRYGPGTQLPFATFLGNPLARLITEFTPMCPTEEHAIYFAHLIRTQLGQNAAVLDSIIREARAPAAAAAAAAPRSNE